MAARGTLFVHASPPALCPHVEWAVAGQLGVPVSMTWTAQPAEPALLRAELGWRGSAGMAGRIATALKPWSMLRYEVTEEPSPGVDGQRFSHSPTLGLFAARTSANGDIVVAEDQLRALLSRASGPEALAHALDRLLGGAWDADLEPFRQAGEGAPVTWMHQVV